MGNLELFVFTDLLHTINIALHQIRILMVFVHMEYMVSRGTQHLRSLSQDHCLQYVDQLCDVCHLHTVTVLVENI